MIRLKNRKIVETEYALIPSTELIDEEDFVIAKQYNTYYISDSLYNRYITVSTELEKAKKDLNNTSKWNKVKQYACKLLIKDLTKELSEINEFCLTKIHETNDIYEIISEV